MREAIKAILGVKKLEELLKQTQQYPILLTPQATTAIDKLLVELYQAKQEDTVDFINESYGICKLQNCMDLDHFW